jgi:DNA-binding GntR family transcriptional regulator
MAVDSGSPEERKINIEEALHFYASFYESAGSWTLQAALALEDKDYARCEALDTVFHETLIALSGNKYLVESYRSISTKVRALRSRLPQNHVRVAGAMARHRRIIDLVAVGKAEAASAEIASHVRNVKHQLLPVTAGDAAWMAAG